MPQVFRRQDRPAKPDGLTKQVCNLTHPPDIPVPYPRTDVFGMGYFAWHDNPT
jgi:hypothetical protein